MNFSKEDFIVFDRENKKLYGDLLLSNGISDVNRITCDFMNRVSTVFDEFLRQNRVTIACRAGCCYCCRYNRVEIFLIEAFAIVNYINQQFNRQQIDALKKLLAEPIQPERQLRSNKTLSATYYRQCAFLQEGECRIYAVRPLNCRVFHSMDDRLCEKKFLDPKSSVADPADIRLKRRLHALMAAYEAAFLRMGYNMVRNELNQAVDALLDEPAVIEEWIKTKTSE